MAEVPGQSLAVQTQRAFPFLSPQQLGMMLAAATLAAVLVAGYLWSQAPDYRVLYVNLSDRDGGAVIAALQTLNVQYKFADGGALMVPADRVHEARLKLAAQGMPKGGNVGFELMEAQKFGVSQFAEQINYQRALEGELARSIESLAAVQNARVHLALSKSSAFMREQPKPSASVLLNLYPGRALDAVQVSAVVHLVSNSVSDLQGKNVSVVDQNGNLLSAEGGAVTARGALGPSQLKYRVALENSYAQRIEAILTPIAGPNNIRAQVNADLDFSEIDHAEEVYKPNQDPASAVIRSQQTSEATTTPNAAGGIPGALTNQPPGQPVAPIDTPPVAPGAKPAVAAAPPPAMPADVRKDATTNYEVDKSIRHTRHETGRLKRLAVAVVVNHRRLTDTAGKTTSKPLSETEITQMTDLVRQVIGYDQERGDTVSVMSSAFNVPEKEKFVDVPLWKQPDTINTAKMIGKNLLIAGVLLLIVFGVLKPALKSLAAPARAAGADEASDDDGDPPRLTAATYQENVDRAKQLARNDPKVAATIVKEWVSDGK